MMARRKINRLPSPSTIYDSDDPRLSERTLEGLPRMFFWRLVKVEVLRLLDYLGMLRMLTRVGLLATSTSALGTGRASLAICAIISH